MGYDGSGFGSGESSRKGPAIRYLVESALREVSSGRCGAQPRGPQDWVDRLCVALVSDSETSHQSVLAALVARGVTTEEILRDYVPAAARALGEKWVADELSFVDVTVGASRLQRLYRDSGVRDLGDWSGRIVPLGQSVLMVVPAFEDHALGAFAAADQFRRHGIWVHMSIAMDREELAAVLGARSFAMVGITLSTWNTVEKATGLVDYLRSSVGHVPPIVIGGRVVEDRQLIERRTGADFAVQTAREAVEKCGLSTVAGSLELFGAT